MRPPRRSASLGRRAVRGSTGRERRGGYGNDCGLRGEVLVVDEGVGEVVPSALRHLLFCG